MRMKLLLPLALVGVTAMGVFAASGIGSATSDRSGLAGDRERVRLDVERGPLPAGAVTAGTTSAINSAKKRKKVRIQHFFASEDVPADPSSDLVTLVCPGKAKVLSGDYITNGGVFADWFAPASPKSWEFGFQDFSGADGLANPGITCAKGVK